MTLPKIPSCVPKLTGAYRSSAAALLWAGATYRECIKILRKKRCWGADLFQAAEGKGTHQRYRPYHVTDSRALRLCFLRPFCKAVQGQWGNDFVGVPSAFSQEFRREERINESGFGQRICQLLGETAVLFFYAIDGKTHLYHYTICKRNIRVFHWVYWRRYFANKLYGIFVKSAKNKTAFSITFFFYLHFLRAKGIIKKYRSWKVAECYFIYIIFI